MVLLHDHLITSIAVGPRRALTLEAVSPLERLVTTLRVSAIENFPDVERWYAASATSILRANAGQEQLRIDGVAERQLGSGRYEYALEIEGLQLLKLSTSKRANVASGPGEPT